MTVKELKKMLANFDDDLEVLGSDSDGYFYSYHTSRIAYVFEGSEVEKNDEDKVVVLI